ncbi:hypothetical protein Pan54_51300 [Rubinisphaera italica]|uniref:Uncharacterized protein n=1 Tax=Rubinisphaera italica TaxID=2527969 RepID=A0A5C5XNS2_9PLAN|nr:hypothetical protein Pan54_51300 [Rubinisphaera italica]
MTLSASPYSRESAGTVSVMANHSAAAKASKRVDDAENDDYKIRSQFEVSGAANWRPRSFSFF